MRIKYIIPLLAALLLAVPAWAQPITEPKAKAPVTKAEPATPPASAVPVAPVDAPKDETKAEAPKEVPAAPVAAETVTEVSWWKVLLSHVMELAFALLGLLLSGLVTVLMKKYGFEDQSAKINQLLEKAVGYAEQKAVAASKLEKGKKTSGAEKMELAIQFAEKLSADYKLKGKGKDWWEMKLESWIGVKKNGIST